MISAGRQKLMIRDTNLLKCSGYLIYKKISDRLVQVHQLIWYDIRFQLSHLAFGFLLFFGK